MLCTGKLISATQVVDGEVQGIRWSIHAVSNCNMMSASKFFQGHIMPTMPKRVELKCLRAKGEKLFEVGCCSCFQKTVLEGFDESKHDLMMQYMSR